MGEEEGKWPRQSQGEMTLTRAWNRQSAREFWVADSPLLWMYFSFLTAVVCVYQAWLSFACLIRNGNQNSVYLIWLLWCLAELPVKHITGSDVTEVLSKYQLIFVVTLLLLPHLSMLSCCLIPPTSTSYFWFYFSILVLLLFRIFSCPKFCFYPLTFPYYICPFLLAFCPAFHPHLCKNEHI